MIKLQNLDQRAILMEQVEAAELRNFAITSLYN